jgi:diguanylate cyclase (GGDEF)-like protein
MTQGGPLVDQPVNDPVTGAFPRALLSSRLDHELAGDSPFAVFLFDLDYFKTVNDAYGHLRGDEVLGQLAGRIKSLVRGADELYRYGGDEFVLLLPGTGQAGAEEVAQRMHDCLAEPFAAPGAEVVIRASIGVSVVWTGSVDGDELLRQAVAAMRHAKSVGQSTCVFDETLQVRATYQRDVERDLRLALERGELVVHYQPLIAIQGRDIVGAEALVRWQHPERGMVPPLEFIPVAELDWAIDQLAEVLAAGPRRPGAASSPRR